MFDTSSQLKLIIEIIKLLLICGRGFSSCHMSLLRKKIKLEVNDLSVFDEALARKVKIITIVHQSLHL